MHLTHDGPPSLGVAQDACMVYERLWLGVCRDVLLYEQPLDVKEIALKRVQEPASLQVL